MLDRINFAHHIFLNINGISINGSSLSKMLSDKIYAISGDNVCRRVKDILDIYVMSFVTKVDLDELYRIWMETGRELGNFEAYRRQIVEIGNAYDKMKGIKNKPNFVEVYSRVNSIICKLEYQKTNY